MGISTDTASTIVSQRRQQLQCLQLGHQDLPAVEELTV